MNIAITGSSGFVGQALVSYLVHYETIYIGRRKPQGIEEPDFCKCSLNKDQAFADIFSDTDVVIHLAAKTHTMNNVGKNAYDEYRDINTCSTINIARQATESGVKRFNRPVRHEWLDLYEFHSVEHAQLLATQWLWIYNNERPHTAIGGIPPRKLLEVA